MSKCPFDFSRRSFLALTGGVAAIAGAGFGARSAIDAIAAHGPSLSSSDNQVPFRGQHQAGIITPAPAHTYFASFDLMTERRDEIIKLLQRWTIASSRMARGELLTDLVSGDEQSDTGDVIGLPASKLTLTFGFGHGLFTKDGKDRYGLAAQRPAAFVDLPKFAGDQLVPERTGGDISVQACAEDAQVAFHAVRQLVRLAYDVAQIRWTQAGFLANPPKGGGSPRNLMGFKDGSGNPSVDDVDEMNKFVWVGDEGPDWMRGGSYLVARRSRIALEHWDKMKLAFQEQTIGRQKLSGAPLGKEKETDSVDLEIADKDGNPYIPENSHVRLATAASNDGAKILRRSYSYNDGVNLTAERWPPWRQGMEYDAGLLFICYQRDPRTGFIKIFDTMSKFDMLNQFVTHVGGGMFACPGGAQGDEYIGQRLLSSA